MIRYTLPLVLLALAIGVPTKSLASKSQVDLLLCLAADASASVSDFEYALQRAGHAEAIEDEEVLDAIAGGHHGKIAVAYVEWARPDQQHLGADWTVIDGPESASQFAEQIRTAPQPPWIGFNVRDTSTGDAIRYCMKQFESAPVRAARKIIDISSDGTSNVGVRASQARDHALNAGATINVLAIARPVNRSLSFGHTRPEGGLINYFIENVAGGTGSFVEPAAGYESFAVMMRKKFLVEIAGNAALATTRSR